MLAEDSELGVIKRGTLRQLSAEATELAANLAILRDEFKGDEA